MSRKEQDIVAVDRWLVSEWMTSLTEALERKTGERPRLERLDIPGKAATPRDLIWWSQPFSIIDGSAVWIGIAEDDCLALSSRTSPDSGLAGDALEEIGNVLAESFSALGKVLSRRGKEAITCSTGTQVFDAPEDLQVVGMDVNFRDSRPFRFYWVVDPDFLDLLQQAIPVDAAQGSGVPSYSKVAPPPETLALLLDLELPVSVSFGRVQIPFQDVLKLSTGSIIELNRSIDDPVEIIVNEQVIASGEVVVVNGNYGVRIKHIASRTERLRSADSVLLARGFEVNPWDDTAAV